MTAAILPGLGTTLAYSAAGTAFTTMVQVVSIDGPSVEVGTVETTNLSTTGYKTYRPTIADGGEVSVELYYDLAESTHSFFTALLATPPATPTYFKLAFADAHVSTHDNITFQANVTGWEVSGMEEESNVSATLTLQITGAVTFTAGS